MNVRLSKAARQLIEHAKQLKWTPARLAVAALLLWGILLLAFHEGRMCYPTIAECRAQFFASVGDAVWLRYWKEWQTLIAGLVAIGAALIGGHYIKKQIEQTANLEQDRIAREFGAVRAMMPIYLDKLIDHILHCGRELRALFMMDSVGALPTQRQAAWFPVLPIDVAEFLRSAVLRASPEVRAPIIIILAELQVFHARLTDLESTARRGVHSVSPMFGDYILQAMDLHARCVAMLPYARNQSEDLPTAAMIRGLYLSALQWMGFDQSQFEHLYDRAVRMMTVETEKPEK